MIVVDVAITWKDEDEEEETLKEGGFIRIHSLVWSVSISIGVF